MLKTHANKRKGTYQQEIEKNNKSRVRWKWKAYILYNWFPRSMHLDIYKIHEFAAIPNWDSSIDPPNTCMVQASHAARSRNN